MSCYITACTILSPQIWTWMVALKYWKIRRQNDSGFLFLNDEFLEVLICCFWTLINKGYRKKSLEFRSRVVTV